MIIYIDFEQRIEVSKKEWSDLDAIEQEPDDREEVGENETPF